VLATVRSARTSVGRAACTRASTLCRGDHRALPQSALACAAESRDVTSSRSESAHRNRLVARHPFITARAPRQQFGGRNSAAAARRLESSVNRTSGLDRGALRRSSRHIDGTPDKV
jgi:hypothetical protein